MIFRFFEPEVRTELPLDEFPLFLALPGALVCWFLPFALDRLPWFGLREVLGVGPRGKDVFSGQCSFLFAGNPFSVPHVITETTRMVHRLAVDAVPRVSILDSHPAYIGVVLLGGDKVPPPLEYVGAIVAAQKI